MANFSCPSCKHGISAVIDSRGDGVTIRRRRKCLECNHRWTTYEVLLVRRSNGPKPKIEVQKSYNVVYPHDVPRPTILSEAWGK